MCFSFLFFFWYARTHARESENASHSMNRCHASAVQGICLIFFLINGVVAKTLEQCAFHQEMKCSRVVSPSVAGSSPLHMRLPYFCNKINNCFEDNKRRRGSRSQLEIMIIGVWHHHPLTSYQTAEHVSQRKNVDEERRAQSRPVRRSFTSMSQTSRARTKTWFHGCASSSLNHRNTFVVS